MSPYAELIRRHSRPLTPVPTQVTPRLVPMPSVRAVLLDVYGTLFISGSGDLGTAAGWHAPSPRGAWCGTSTPFPERQGAPPAEALADAFDELGIGLACTPAEGVAWLLETIESHHAEARQRGIAHPEVDIVRVWHDVYPTIAASTRQALAAGRVDLRRLAVAYEVRVNPVWPMPHLEPCLTALGGGGRRLGIVSNAQFFTPELFPALLGKSLGELGFDPRCQYYSYQHGEAKPSEHLYRLAAESLAADGIRAADVLYIGNDLRNDVRPASAVGFRTALFAGDARSLRLRENDPQLAGVEPDAVVTDLAQVPKLLMEQPPTLPGDN